MTAPDYPDGEFFSVVPLDTAEHAVTVELVVGMVQLGFLGPVVTTRHTLTRQEALSVALAMVDASQFKEEVR